MATVTVRVNAYYVMRGFKIVELRADQKFEPSRAVLTYIKIEMNTSVRNDNVPEIDRINRKMKERI